MKTVAVIGASNDRTKYANKAVRAFQKAGYKVFPVHPAQSEVEQLPCFKTIRDVPEAPTVISVYVGPERLLQILPDIAARGCDELFLNPGTDTAPVQEAIVALGHDGHAVPTIVSCLFENVALAAAHGYFAITGNAS